MEQESKVLFYGNFEANTLDTCLLITSADALKQYSDNDYPIDFDKNAVMVILKPWTSTFHQITFKDLTVNGDEMIVTYIYEVTNMEVEGPPKKFGLLIPMSDKPVKIIEHSIIHDVESEKAIEIVVNN